MQFGDPVKALHEAMASAIHRDLPDVTYERKRWTKKVRTTDDLNDYVMETHSRRPYGSEVDVVLFQQLWGSTALGYGGLGGSAMTYGYTVIVTMNEVSCVYFGDGGHLAYTIFLKNLTTEQEANLEACFNERNFYDIRNALNTFKGAIKPYKGYSEDEF